MADGRPAALGCIGLGIMGGRMARRLLDAGYPLTVWNRTEERSRTFAAQHAARAATTPREAVQQAEVVITSGGTGIVMRHSLRGGRERPGPDSWWFKYPYEKRRLRTAPTQALAHEYPSETRSPAVDIELLWVENLTVDVSRLNDCRNRLTSN